MIKTFGLTHINLSVKDPEESLKFYHSVFGIEEYFRDELTIHAKTPGANDVITFTKSLDKNIRQSAGIIHFGFRLVKPQDIDAAKSVVEKAGGKILSSGEFSPGFPYLYFIDPDGYEVEIWFE
jgi:predicted enzyme related to lactoylglutathione lyase